jgi:hypothetical protein
MKLSWWWIADRAEYALTSLRLAILDKICGPEPLTQADEVRERRRERLQKAFPEIDIDRRRPRG